MLVRVRKGSRIMELSYNPMEGIDFLQLQITSILDETADKPPYLLMDFAGREISSHEDIEDIKVVEINEIETSDHELLTEANRLEGLETNMAANVSADEWEQHIDVSNATILSSSEYESAAHARRRASGSNSTISAAAVSIPLRSPNGSADVVSRSSSSVSLVRANAVADIWAVNSDLVRIGEYCTGELFPNDESIVQSCYRLIDSPFRLCTRCKKLFDESIIVSETVNLSHFVCEGKRAVEMGLAYPWASETLNMESVLIKTTYERNGPAGLYLRRALLGEAISMQPPKSLAALSEEEREFSRRLSSGCDTVKAYEDPEQQDAARSVIDYEKVGFYASEYLRESGGSTDSNGEAKNEDVAFVTGLLRWFKNDFFKWVNKPACENPRTCEARASKMESIGVQMPTEEERSVGGAGRVEVYRCNECQFITRFPRFNKPSHLLKTRRGRCGEWANAFCLVCRSLSLDARWVLDFTDHVWVEVWIPSLRRFVHADPCEKRLDAPLMYEAGWNKKLTHILSFSRYGVVDASPRYSRRLADLISRRSAVSERLMHEMVKSTDEQLEQAFVANRGDRGGGSQSSSSLLNLEALVHGQAGFGELAGADISLMTMRRRKRLLSRELLAMTMLAGGDTKLEELQGRISGDQAWKESRGEQGSGGAVVSPPVVQTNFRFPIEVIRRPAWLLPGLMCSSTALKSGYIDIDVTSFDLESCKRFNPPPSSSSSSSSSPAAGSEFPCNASAIVPHPQSSIITGNVTTSIGARGINAVALCPKTGSLRSSATFAIDTGTVATIVVPPLLPDQQEQEQLQPQQQQQQQQQQQLQSDTVFSCATTSDSLNSLTTVPALSPPLPVSSSEFDSFLRDSLFAHSSSVTAADTALERTEGEGEGEGGGESQQSLVVAENERQHLDGGIGIDTQQEQTDNTASLPLPAVSDTTTDQHTYDTPPHPPTTSTVLSGGRSSSGSISSSGGSIVILTALEDGAEHATYTFGQQQHLAAYNPSSSSSGFFDGGPRASSSAHDHSPGDAAPAVPGSWLMIAPPPLNTTAAASSSSSTSAATAAAVVEDHAVEGLGPCRIRARYALSSVDRPPSSSSSLTSSSTSLAPNVVVSIVKLEGQGHGEGGLGGEESGPGSGSGFMCSVPSHVITPQDGESAEDLVERATAFCLSAAGADSLGFVLCTDGHVVVFGDAGYPLRHSSGATTYLKTVVAAPSSAGSGSTSAGSTPCIDNGSTPSVTDEHPAPTSTLPFTQAHVSSSSLASHPTVVLKYVALGGGSHGDTLDFDTTQFLWPLMDRVGEALPMTADTGMSWSALWNRLRIEEISFWSGNSIANGVQVNFSLPLPTCSLPSTATATATVRSSSSSSNGHSDSASAPTPISAAVAPIGASATTPTTAAATPITLRLKSPTFASDHDSPRRTVFRLYPDDRVTYIAVRSGHLVDNVFLRTAAGWTFSAGGSGGGNLRTLTIPEGWKFIGFYGGTGGHLHNIGAVLLRDDSSSSSSSSGAFAGTGEEGGRRLESSIHSNSSSLSSSSSANTATSTTSATVGTSTTSTAAAGVVVAAAGIAITSQQQVASFPALSLRLLQLCDELSLWDCGLLNHCQHRSDQRRHALVGRLIELTSNVIRRNSYTDCLLCLETCAVYSENIAKNTGDKRLRKVKVRNAFLTKNVMCAEGGLELFTFGPAAFRLTADGSAMESSVSLLSEGGDLSRDIWVKWLKAYSGFLRAAVAIVKSSATTH